MSELTMAGCPNHRPRLAASAGSVLQGLKKQVQNHWAHWSARRRQRAALISLSDVELKDLGISRAQANFDYDRLYWHS